MVRDTVWLSPSADSARALFRSSLDGNPASRHKPKRGVKPTMPLSAAQEEALRIVRRSRSCIHRGRARSRAAPPARARVTLGSLRRCKLTWACVVGLFLSACREQPYSGPLAEYVRQTKQNNRTSTSVTELFDSTEGDLKSLLGTYSLVVVSPVPVDAAQTVSESAIHTWTVFHLAEVLASRAPSPKGCTWQLPNALRLQPGEVAFGRGCGSVTIDGVEIAMKTNEWLPADSTRNYLVFAVLCPNRVAYSALPMLGRESLRSLRPAESSPSVEPVSSCKSRWRLWARSIA